MTQHVKLETKPEYSIIRFNDLTNIDANSAHRVKAEVKGVITLETKNLFVDLAGIGFIDSTGFGALISILKSMKGQEGRMLLFNVSPEIEELMDLMQLTTVFDVQKNLSAAEAAIK